MTAEKSTPFVLDCSLTMTWCFTDEASVYTRSVLAALIDTRAFVPSLWPFEVSNVLKGALHKKLITKAQVARFLELIEKLPISIEPSMNVRRMGHLIDLANDYRLSAYDAAYLALAMQQGIALATLDKELQHAAKEVGVAIYAPR